MMMNPGQKQIGVIPKTDQRFMPIFW